MLTQGTLITIFHPTTGDEILATIAEVQILGRSPLYHVRWNTNNPEVHSNTGVYTHDIISIVEKVMVYQELGD